MLGMQQALTGYSAKDGLIVMQLLGKSLNAI